MTEFEINKKVAQKLGYIYTKSFDPCNNAEQAWEIMLKYNICVVKNMYEDYYDAYVNLNITEYYTEYKHDHYDKKTFRSCDVTLS